MLIPVLREKWGSLSEFVKKIKQGFSRFYNRRYRRKGFFWSDRFKSGIIGTKEFVSRVYQDFKGYFTSRHEKRPKPVQGLDGIYSLKRLSENIA